MPLIKLYFVLLTFIFCQYVNAQDTIKQDATIKWNCFIDVYYSYDFNKPANHTKPAFLYNYTRHNEFNINIGMAGVFYESETGRANLRVMAGTYPQANLSSEPELLRHIYEANVGIKLSRQKKLWADAGIFPSHIGFESVISKDCWTLTRSILAENSPYYEAGLKLSYKTTNDKWLIAGLLLNGWQRIKRVDGNNTPAFGTQLLFTPSAQLTINSSSFIGSDKPDSIRRWRYFHNVYAIWQLSKAWGITMGFDIGTEQITKNSADFYTWYSPVIILRYSKNDWAIAGRAEYFSDKAGVVVPLVNGPFQMQGYSLNADRNIKNFLFRIEGRWLKNAIPYFERGSTRVKDNVSITTSLSFSLEGVLDKKTK